MLHDGPPQQIKLKHFVWEYQIGLKIEMNRPGLLIDEELMPAFEQQPPKVFDFRPFERGKKNVVNVLSVFLSKSESVFCEAGDAIDEAIDEGISDFLFPEYQLLSHLSECHAFDNGDAQAVGWIESERQDVINRVNPHRVFGAPVPLEELESKESFFVQAADFAGGIAQAIWRRDSLPRLTTTFDYVTYNGKRISESEAGIIDADLAKRNNLWS